MASLRDYQKKRDFTKTPEPRGKVKPEKGKARFTVQKHRATRLHYDLRLELEGTLKSWAVPKGPSLDPSVKRLAMMVEDHPLDYIDFEGVIPEGNYGAGNVIVWDRGTFRHPAARGVKEGQKLLSEGLAKGDLKFVLEGKKLKGEFVLVRIGRKQAGAGEGKQWLLIKKKDEFATSEEITGEDRSVISGRTVEGVSTRKEWVSNKPRKGAKPKRANPRKADPLKDLLTGEDLEKAPAAAMPKGITPMLASLVDEPFDDPNWLFELKWDGYRAIAEIEDGEVSLYSRNRKPFNRKFHPVAESLESLGHSAVLDGEIVVADDEGKAHFQLLQNYERSGQGELIYYVFDLLYLDGRDLRALPLQRRKEILRSVLPGTNGIRFSDHVKEAGISFFRLVQEKGLEGMMAKESRSAYQSGKRTRQWLKVKTKLRQETVIGGFTEPRGSRKHFGSLVLGVYEGSDLVYVGHSGGGFDSVLLKEIRKKLDPLIQENCPFREKPKTNMPARWVKPVLVAEVTFSEWTDEGLMRHPIFLGLREDVDPRSVVRENPSERSPSAEDNKQRGREERPGEKEDAQLDRHVPRKPRPLKRGQGAPYNESTLPGSPALQGVELQIGGRKLKLTHLKKVFWPEEGFTKGDLLDYYTDVSATLLPYLRGRPESLYRTPDGIKGEGFFQKDMRDLTPEWIPIEEIPSDSNEKTIKYLICNDEATLIYMVNLGCVEINPWFSRVESLHSPDYLVLDLDPLEVSFEKVIDAALVIKEVLDLAGARSFIKTSGATGMHIYVPLHATYDYDVAKNFAQLIGQIAHGRAPDFTSLERLPSKRKKRVYLDFLQNRIGQTLAAPYSVRPRPGAPVSMPLKWSEVKPGLNPLSFNLRTAKERIEKHGDLFRGVLGPGIDLAKCVKNLQSKV